MGRIRINAGSGGYQPLPAGTYQFEVTALAEGTSKSGNPQLQITMRVADGPHEGKKASVWATLTPTALWYLYAIVDAAGAEKTETGDEDADGNPIYDFETEDLIGAYVQFDVEQDTYQGKEKNNFKNPKPSFLAHPRQATRATASAEAPRRAPAAEAPKAPQRTTRHVPRPEPEPEPEPEVDEPEPEPLPRRTRSRGS